VKHRLIVENADVMAEGPALALVRRIYGFNWASVSGRREGLELALELFAPDFTYRLDPGAYGGRTLKSVTGVEEFLTGIGEDFRDFRQRADRFIDAGERDDGHRIVVLGEFVGKGRLSGLPFRSPFGHVWTVAGGKLARLEGFLDQEVTLAVAGLDEA
jgi:ketosteroid isomerase-like protein